MSYQSGRGGGARRQASRRKLNTSRIRIAPAQGERLDPELFNEIARAVAREVADCGGMVNKSTQLRRFYDEIVMWDEKVIASPDKFDDYLPFIRMLNAKAAYAEGRRHVDGAFVDLVGHCVQQVKRRQDMRTFKLFFEAFMGFYKLEKDG